MLESLPVPSLFGLALLGGGTLLGLLGMTARFGTLHRVLVPAVLAVLFAVVSAVLAAAGQPAGVRMAPLPLTVLCGLFALLRSPWPGFFGALALKLASRPRLQWAALLLACPALMAGWVAASLYSVPEWSHDAAYEFSHTPVGILQISRATVLTDAGQTLPVYRPAAPASAAELAAADAGMFANGEFAARALRTAPPTDAYNCHGWTFTGGRYWIQGEAVEPILRDNGYKPVTEPRPGDVVVYRDGTGAVLHSGVVFSADEGRPVLVESKWGKSGRYLHAFDDQPYQGVCTYYHSTRVAGNLLRGLDGETSTATTLAMH